MDPEKRVYDHHYPLLCSHTENYSIDTPYIYHGHWDVYVDLLVFLWGKLKIFELLLVGKNWKIGKKKVVFGLFVKGLIWYVLANFASKCFKKVFSIEKIVIFAKTNDLFCKEARSHCIIKNIYKQHILWSKLDTFMEFGINIFLFMTGIYGDFCIFSKSFSGPPKTIWDHCYFVWLFSQQQLVLTKNKNPVYFFLPDKGFFLSLFTAVFGKKNFLIVFVRQKKNK